MADKKALYISQEINPYLNPSKLSVLNREVAQGMQARGYEVRTFMPKYGCINERRNQLHEVIRLSGVNISIADSDHPLIIKVATLQPSRLQVYFIDNDDFFHPHSSDKLETEEYPDDNDERAIFFSLGVVETVRKLKWYPQLIHCTGWLTSLCPLFIKSKYPDDAAFKDAKLVFSLSGDAFPGALSPEMLKKLASENVPADYLKVISGGDIDFKALMRLGIDMSDAVVEATNDVDPELVEYAKASGKPFLPFPGLDNPQAYADFYETL